MKAEVEEFSGGAKLEVKFSGSNVYQDEKNDTNVISTTTTTTTLLSNETMSANESVANARESCQWFGIGFAEEPEMVCSLGNLNNYNLSSHRKKFMLINIMLMDPQEN